MTWSVAPVLGCRDVRKAAEWYRDVLGFTLAPEAIFEGPGDEGAVYAIVGRGNAGVHLQIRRFDLPEKREDIESDAYVYVDDVDALYGEFQAAGVTIHREIYDEPYGMRDFCIEDVEGHRVNFGTAI